MQHRVELGYIINSFMLNNDASQDVTTGTDHTNWGFTYTVNSADESTGGPSEEAGTSKSDYPEGTIFLDSGIDEIYGTSILNNIVINTIPPELVSDSSDKTAIYEPFTIKVEYNSKTDIDVANLSIKLGDHTLVLANRATGNYVVNDYISDLKLTYYGSSKYVLSCKFDAAGYAENVGKEIDDIVDTMNEDGINIIVYDISGNKCESQLTDWIYIGDDTDIADLLPIEIEFYDWKPTDRILSPTVNGTTWVKVYNPNVLWRKKELLTVQNKEGSTFGLIPDSDLWDWTNYEENGVVIFYINSNIDKPGTIELEGWLSVVNDKSGLIRSSTYGEANLEWKYMDPDGRKIALKPYVPNHLQGEKFEEFVQFTEDFLNTMYESLYNDNKNIGILEKIARIGYFNVPDQIEDPFLQEYADCHGAELQLSQDDAKIFLENKKINGNYASGIIDDDTYNNYIRYIYHELPIYNQYKGSYTGIKMTMSMLNLCCKLVELWSRVDDSSEDDFIRADEINDDPLKLTTNDKAQIAKYYLTSRFDVDIQDNDADFEHYNEIAQNIVNVIFQVKPITRTLRKLCKVWYSFYNMKLSYFIFGQENVQQIHHYHYEYNLCSKYAYNDITESWRHNTEVTDNGNVIINSLFIPYMAECAHVGYLTPDEEYVTNPTSLNSYVVLDKLDKYFYPYFNTDGNQSYTFKLKLSYKKTYKENTTPYESSTESDAIKYIVYTDINPTSGKNVKITNNSNGYVLTFSNGDLVSNVFKKDGNQVLLMNYTRKWFNNKFTYVYETTENDQTVYYYDPEIRFIVEYDVCLGTHYITQNLPTNTWTVTTTEEGHSATNAVTETTAPMLIELSDEVIKS